MLEVPAQYQYLSTCISTTKKSGTTNSDQSIFMLLIVKVKNIEIFINSTELGLNLSKIPNKISA